MHSRRAAILISCLTLFVATAIPSSASPQQASGKPSAENQASPSLKVSTDLVVVRVVVRDAQGKPVEGLRKEDFKLFDQGAQQKIAQFDAETSPSSPAKPLGAPASREQTLAPATPSEPVLPGKFIAFYFDDINASDSDLIQARDAADRYLSANLQLQDRVAIFTSQQRLSDFTSDRKQIHEALLKLRATSRSVARNHDCPDISDFQALQISENPSSQQIDAWQAALDEAKHCDTGFDSSAMQGQGSPAAPGAPAQPGMTTSSAPGSATGRILQKARVIADQIDLLARSNLEQLQQVINYISQMPGQRTIVLVSPDFISQGEQSQLDSLIDRALRAQVVISSLDPKGLAILMREFDASRNYSPTGNALRAEHGVDSMRESVATSVLADVAEGTGGQFFHDSNDLTAGFGAVAGSPAYYILAFAPTAMKADGKFHQLKVTLTEKQKGFTIQARRGYFAPKNGDSRVMEAKDAQIPNADAAVQEQIREAILSKTDVTQIPIDLTVKLPESPGATHDVVLSAHLDAKQLHFQKDGEHNLNTVMFFFAVFDQKDNLLDAQLRRARVNVLDNQLPSLMNSGVTVNITFQLKPGSYRIREVVTESEQNQMASLSRSVNVP